LNEFARSPATGHLYDHCCQVSKQVVPDNDCDGFEKTQRQEFGRIGDADALRREPKPQQYEGYENRPVDQFEEFVVDVGRRTSHDSGNHSRKDPVCDLANYDKYQRYCKCLQIGIRPDQFCPLLYLLDCFVQFTFELISR
jgi:hypothetical protein